MLFHALKTEHEGRIYPGFKPVSLMIDADYADIIVFPAQCSFVAPLGFSSYSEIKTVFIEGVEVSIDDLKQYMEDCKHGMSVVLSSMEDLA